MDILIANDYETADKIARDLYNKECDALGCLTPEGERISKSRDFPLYNEDAKSFAAQVFDKSLLSASDTGKISVIDEKNAPTWKRVWTKPDQKVVELQNI